MRIVSFPRMKIKEGIGKIIRKNYDAVILFEGTGLRSISPESSRVGFLATIIISAKISALGTGKMARMSSALERSDK